ncbi:hypothetical protein Y032_0221g2537 [Ancylostoma ceylanicum]|uniref:Uncharacterized protein n=1 Tax=Ancylostoma ceylanicum TaxID=53326 RepID=A0A016SHW2_9BILA|nr:hypothetical protein Y032_0221g2537 [Ancylostoma ceylanicum]
MRAVQGPIRDWRHREGEDQRCAAGSGPGWGTYLVQPYKDRPRPPSKSSSSGPPPSPAPPPATSPSLPHHHSVSPVFATYCGIL